MSLIIKGSPKIELVPEGTYVGRCVQIIDLGTQPNEKYGNSSQKVMIRWELPQETYTDSEGADVPRLINGTYTASLNEKANLRKMLEGWRSKKFTDEELEEFNLGKLIGLPCMLTVVHAVASNGNKYANISAVAALPKGMEAPPQVNESIIFDIDKPEDEPKLEVLPDFIQNIIQNSFEYDKTKSCEVLEELQIEKKDLPF